MRTFALAICVIAILGCKKSNSTAGPGSGSSGVTNRGSGSATGGSGDGSAVTTGGSGDGSAVTTGGSGGGSAVTIGGSGAVTMGGSGGSAATAGGFDDKMEIAKQPDRPKDQQAYVDVAAAAIRAQLTSAQNAKNATVFCKAFAKLDKQVADLEKVAPPKDVDAQAFSDARDKLMNTITISHPGPCDDPADGSMDDMRTFMADIRDEFVAFATMGAK